MTFGRSPGDRSPSTGFGPAPAPAAPALDSPYGGAAADGFGGHGPTADGFGGPPLLAVERMVGPQMAPAPGPNSPLHDVRVDDTGLDLATVVGRPTAPVNVRIVVGGDATIGDKGQFDPAQIHTEFHASIIGDERGREAFELGTRGDLLFPSAAIAGPTLVPITFSPPKPGAYQATLDLLLSERRPGGAIKRVSVMLRGTALPPPDAASGAHGADAPTGDAGPQRPSDAAPEQRPAVSALPDTERPRSAGEARAMLLRAADSLASLGTVHRFNVPMMRQVAMEKLAHLGQVVGQLDQRLTAWLTAEAGASMEGLRTDAMGEFVEYMVGAGLFAAEGISDSAAAGKAAGPAAAAALTVAGVATDLLFTHLDVADATSQNADVGAAVADHAFLGSYLGAAGAKATTSATMRVARLAAWYASAEAQLTATVGPDGSMDGLRDIGALLNAPQKPDAAARAEDAYHESQRRIRVFDQRFRELSMALGSLATASARAESAAQQTIAKIMDAYLRYRAGGPRPGSGDTAGYQAPPKAHVSGNLNLAGELPRLTLTNLRFGGYQARTAPMTEHIQAKTLRDLRGWDTAIELVLDDGTTATLIQPADGSRRIAGAAAARVAIAWRLLDDSNFGAYWVG